MLQDKSKRAAAVGTRLNPSPEQQIRESAYQLYEQRGRADGHEVEDWLRAEAELSRMVAKSAA